METVEKLSADEVKSLEERVSVPYRVDDVTVLSPGEWNGLNWTASELREAVKNTDFTLSRSPGDESPPNSSLFYDHDDRSAENWVGRVENVRFDGGDVKSDLVITDKQLAMNLEYGAPFGVSPKADGLVDQNHKMQDFKFENFSMVINPAVKTTWLNEDIETVLRDMDVHRPSFRGVTEGEWDSPNLNEFTDEQWSDLSDREKRAIGRHFLVSKSGFPADTYTDLALPVVQPNGDLNLNALRQAKARASQVSGIDDDQIVRVQKMINNLANGNFDDAEFEDVSMSGHKEEEEMSEELQDWTVHRPEWSSKADQEWNKPNLEDFTGGDSEWEDLEEGRRNEIGDHFLASSTGFPADSFGDMALPVVEPDRTLNLNALANAKARAGQVKGMSEDTVERVKSMITRIANEEFPDADFESVENDGDGSEEAEENNDFNEDTEVKTTMAEEEQEEQEPETEESVEEESVENSDDNVVTKDELEEFRKELLEDVKELAEDDDEEAEDEDVEEAEEEDEELSEFEEFVRENPDLSPTEAAELFEEESKDVDEKLEEMKDQFEDKIEDLAAKLEEKEEEVEELSEKVPQRATQASDDGDDEDLREKVANLSDDELHATIFQQMQEKQGARIDREVMF